MADNDAYQHGTVDDSPGATITVAAGTRRVRVINRTGTGPLAFTTNGATPSLTGNNPVLPASVGASATKDMEGGGTAVKLLSDATGTAFSVWVVE